MTIFCGKPLTFGDPEQIAEIHRLQQAEENRRNRCDDCQGEGVVQCAACEGTGKKEVKK